MTADAKSRGLRANANSRAEILNRVAEHLMGTISGTPSPPAQRVEEAIRVLDELCFERVRSPEVSEGGEKGL